MSALPIIEPAPSDAELIARARAGSDEAFTELYARHAAAAQAAARALTRSRATAEDLVAEGFTRLLSALRNGAGPEVAFRPYLLACVRNAFYDRTRKDSRVDWAPDVEAAVSGESLALLDPNMDPEERHLIARAFTTLPERWQLVLWHTEVEGRQPADVAPLLGLAPNAVAALAYRAREGLRKAYLQAHLQAQPPEACRFTRERLGAYVRDGVNPREREQIEAHLDHCGDCKAMYLELVDVDSTLRRALIPLVIGVSPAAYLKLIGGGGVVKWVSRSSRAQAAVAAVTIAAVVTGAVLVANATDRDQNIEAVAPSSSVGRTTTTRADLGTIAPPTRRPSTSTGSIPTLTVPPPPTVITVIRPPTPGRETSSVAPGATVVPTVTTPPRNTTTTRRPTTTPTTRQPTATTVRPTTTVSPSTIGGQPDGRPPSTPAPGSGGGGPIVSPPPLGPASFEFPAGQNPSFATEAYAGDTVLVNFPVHNNGGAGGPTVTLNVTGAGTPRSGALSGLGPSAGPSRAAQIPGCTLVAGSASTYTCPDVPARGDAVLSFPIELGARDTTVTLSATIGDETSLTISRTILDPIGTSWSLNAPGDPAGTFKVTVTNRAQRLTATNRNPLTVQSPEFVTVVPAPIEDPSPTVNACGLQILVFGGFSCPNLPELGPQASVTLTLLVTLKGGDVFEPVVTVGDEPPKPPTAPASLTPSGPFPGDALHIRSSEVTPQPIDAPIAWAALIWPGDSTVTFDGRPFASCTAQVIEGFRFHSCDVTDRKDLYTARIEGAPDWRVVIVLDRPDVPDTFELFSSVEPTVIPTNEDHFSLPAKIGGIASVGVLGFRGSNEGYAIVSGEGKACTLANPYPFELSVTAPGASNAACPTSGNIRFDFYGSAAVIPKLFIVQRPA